MNFITIPTSKGRQNFRKIINEVDETGKIAIFTVHGKPKVAMIDIELFDDFIENTEFGISQKELLKRAKEPTISLEKFKKQFNV